MLTFVKFYFLMYIKVNNTIEVNIINYWKKCILIIKNQLLTSGTFIFQIVFSIFAKIE